MKRKPELYTRPGKSNIILKNVLNNLRDSDSHNENKQITQCVFLGVLKLKPVPSIFYSNNPSPSAPLDCKLRRVRSSIINKDISKSSSNKPIINKVISGRISKKNPEKVRASVKKIPSKKPTRKIKFNMSDGSNADCQPLEQALRVFPDNLTKIVPDKTFANPLVTLASPVSKQFNPVQNLFDKVKQKIGETYNNPNLTSTDFDSTIVEMRKSSISTEDVIKRTRNSPKRSPKKKNIDTSEDPVPSDVWQISNKNIDSATSVLKQKERTSPRNKKSISPRNVISDYTDVKTNETESDVIIIEEPEGSADNSTDNMDTIFNETRTSKDEDLNGKTTEKPKSRRNRLLPTAIPSIFLTAPRLLRSELAQKKPNLTAKIKNKVKLKQKSEKGYNKANTDKSSKNVNSKSIQYKKTNSPKIPSNEDILFVSEEVKSPNGDDKPSLKLLIRQKKRSEVITEEENLSYEIAESSVAVMVSQDPSLVTRTKQEEEKLTSKDVHNPQQISDIKLLKSNINQSKTFCNIPEKERHTNILEKSNEIIPSAINHQNVNSTVKKKHDLSQEQNLSQVDKPNLNVISEPNMIENVKSDSFKHKYQLSEVGENNNLNEALEPLKLEEKNNPNLNLEVNILQKETSSKIVEEQSVSTSQFSSKEKTTDKDTKKATVIVSKEMQTRSLRSNISQVTVTPSENTELKSIESNAQISEQVAQDVSKVIDSSENNENITEIENNEVQEKTSRTLRSQKLSSEKVIELADVSTVATTEDLNSIGQTGIGIVMQKNLIQTHSSQENIIVEDDIKPIFEEIHQTAHLLEPENSTLRRSIRSIRLQKVENQEKITIDLTNIQMLNKSGDTISIDDDSVKETNKNITEKFEQETSKKQDKLKEINVSETTTAVNLSPSNKGKTKSSMNLRKLTKVSDIKRQSNPKFTPVNTNQNEVSRKRKLTTDSRLKNKFKKAHQSSSLDVDKSNVDLKSSETLVLQRSLRSKKGAVFIDPNESSEGLDQKENNSKTSTRTVSKRSDISKVLSNISSSANKSRAKHIAKNQIDVDDSKKRRSIANAPVKKVTIKEKPKSNNPQSPKEARNENLTKTSRRKISASKVKEKLSNKKSKTVAQVKIGKIDKQKKLAQSNLKNKITKCNSNNKVTKQTPAAEKKDVKKSKNTVQNKEKKLILRTRSVKSQMDKKSQKSQKIKTISRGKYQINKKTGKSLPTKKTLESELKKDPKDVGNKRTVLSLHYERKNKNVRSTRSKNNRLEDAKLDQKTKIAKTNSKKLNKVKMNIAAADSPRQKRTKFGSETQNKAKLKLKTEPVKKSVTTAKKKITVCRASLEKSKKQLLKQSREIRKSKKASFFSKKLLIERIIKTTLKQLNVQKQMIKSSKILRARARAKARAKLRALTQQQEISNNATEVEMKEVENPSLNKADNLEKNDANIEVLAVVPDETPAKPQTSETPLIVISGMNSGEIFQEVVYNNDNVNSQTVEITTNDLDYMQIKEFFENEKKRYSNKLPSNNDVVLVQSDTENKSSKKEKQSKNHSKMSKRDAHVQDLVSPQTNIAGPSHQINVQIDVPNKIRKTSKEKTSEEELDQILSASEAVLQNIQQMTMSISSSQNNSGDKVKNLEKGDLTIFDFNESEPEMETVPLRYKISAKKEMERSDQSDDQISNDSLSNIKKSPLKQPTILEMFDRVITKNQKTKCSAVKSVFSSTPYKSQNEETESAADLNSLKFDGSMRDIQRKCMQLNTSMSTGMPPPSTPKVVKKANSNTNEEEEAEIFDDDDSRSEWMPQELAEYKFKYSAKKVMSYKPIFKCKVCLTLFPSYYKLTKHRMKHVEVQNPYACKLCEQNFNNVEDLVAHIRVHKGKHPYVCQKCDQGFWSKKDFEAHASIHVLRKTKEPVKKFQCDVCKKMFAKLCDVERHSRVHTGEKPFVCNICNKRFQQTHNLSKHLLIHLHVKPFNCEICGKQFGRIDVLNRHVLTHSLIKPFKCPICPKDFIRESQLNHHIKKEHPEALNTEIASELAPSGKSRQAVSENLKESEAQSVNTSNRDESTLVVKFDEDFGSQKENST